MTNYPGHFSRNLSQWREWRGLSMRELGRRTGLSATVISKTEAAGDECNLTLDTMTRLSNGLKLPLETLLKPNSFDEYQARVGRLTREYTND